MTERVEQAARDAYKRFEARCPVRTYVDDGGHRHQHRPADWYRLSVAEQVAWVHAIEPLMRQLEEKKIAEDAATIADPHRETRRSQGEAPTAVGRA